MRRDTGLDTLLNLDGYKYIYPNLYWYRIKVHMVTPTEKRPHGIRYALTFHNNKGERIFGLDNKHVPKNQRKGFHGRIIKYDHVHNSKDDKGTPYNFVNAEKLIIDFFERIDEILNELDE